MDQRSDEEENSIVFKRRNLRFHSIKPGSLMWTRNISKMLQRMGLTEFVVATAMPTLDEDLCAEMIKTFVRKKGLDGGQGKVRGHTIRLCAHSIRRVTELPLGDDLATPDNIRMLRDTAVPVISSSNFYLPRLCHGMVHADDFIAIARVLTEKFLCRDESPDHADASILLGMRFSLRQGIVMPWAAAMARNMADAILRSKERNSVFPFGQWLSCLIRDQLQEERPRKRKAQASPVRKRSQRKRGIELSSSQQGLGTIGVPAGAALDDKVAMLASPDEGTPENSAPSAGKLENDQGTTGEKRTSSQGDVMEELEAAADENLEDTSQPAKGELVNDQGTRAEEVPPFEGGAKGAAGNLGDAAPTMEIASLPVQEEDASATVPDDINVVADIATPMAKAREVEGEVEVIAVSNIDDVALLLDDNQLPAGSTPDEVGAPDDAAISPELQPEGIMETGSATDGRVQFLQRCAMADPVGTVESTLYEARENAAGRNPERDDDFAKAVVDSGIVDKNALDSGDASNSEDASNKRMEMMILELSKLRQQKLDSMVLELNKLREEVVRQKSVKEKLAKADKIYRDLLETAPSTEELASMERELCDLRQKHKEALEFHKVLEESRLKPEESVRHLRDEYKRYKAMLKELQVGPA